MKNETKHTPGPWEAGYGEGVTGPRAAPSVWWETENGPVAIDIPVRRGKDVVCWLASAKMTTEERAALAADAHLISAAPDLLKAAERLTRWLDKDEKFIEESADYVMENGLTAAKFHDELMQAMRAAIAKAKS